MFLRGPLGALGLRPGSAAFLVPTAQQTGPTGMSHGPGPPSRLSPSRAGRQLSVSRVQGPLSLPGPPRGDLRPRIPIGLRRGLGWTKPLGSLLLQLSLGLFPERAQHLKPGLPPLRPCHPTREMRWDPRPSSVCHCRLPGRATWMLWATEGPAGARRPRSRCLTHSPPVPGTPLESVCLALAREPGDPPGPAGSPWADEPGEAAPTCERHTKNLCEVPRPPPPPPWQAQPAPGPARGSGGPVLDEHGHGDRGALRGPHPPGTRQKPESRGARRLSQVRGGPSGSGEGCRPLPGP